jgi:hypothetical protein
MCWDNDHCQLIPDITGQSDCEHSVGCMIPQLDPSEAHSNILTNMTATECASFTYGSVSFGLL